MWKTRPSRITSERDSDSQLAGVCQGIAERYEVDVTFVRIAFILLTLVAFAAGIFMYLLCWFTMPRQGAPLSPVEAILTPKEQLSEADLRERNLGWILLVSLVVFFPSISVGWASSMVIGTFSGVFIAFVAWWLLHQRHPQSLIDDTPTPTYAAYSTPPPNRPLWLLIPVGLLLAVVVFLAGVFVSEIRHGDWSRLGQTTVHITEASELEPIDQSLGALTVDLTELRPLDQPATLEISGHVGSIEVLLPKETIATEVTCSVKVGDVTCPEGKLEGHGKLLTISVHQQVGAIRVVQPF